MPRKARSRPEEKPNQFVLWIEGHVGRRHGVWYKDIAEQIGIKPAAFTRRMESGHFDCLEMVKIFDFLGATNEEIIGLMRKKGV